MYCILDLCPDPSERNQIYQSLRVARNLLTYVIYIMCSLDWDIKYTILWLEESSQDFFKLKKNDLRNVALICYLYWFRKQNQLFDIWCETTKLKLFTFQKKFSTNFSIDGEYALNETIPDWLAMVCKDFWTFQDHISNDHSMPASYMNNLW